MESQPDVSPLEHPGLKPVETEMADRFEVRNPLPHIAPQETEEQPVPFYSRNPLTTIFSVILIVVYLMTSYHNRFQQVEDWAVILGSFYGPAVQNGEWWRFITATLLHDNPMHLFSNVFGIVAFGGLVEPIVRLPRLLFLYVFSMMGGLLLSWLMNPQAVTLGASTIDYGLIGAYLTLALLYRFQSNRHQFFKELRGAIVFTIIFSLWNTMESEHLNLWGHLGGLTAGVGFALCVWPFRRTA